MYTLKRKNKKSDERGDNPHNKKKKKKINANKKGSRNDSG